MQRADQCHPAYWRRGEGNIKLIFMLYFISIFLVHCILLSRFILVMLITFMHCTPLKLISRTPETLSLHHTNYKQIIYSSVDHDQMAFDIQKEINLGSTRLNCYHYHWSVLIVKIKLLSYFKNYMGFLWLGRLTPMLYFRVWPNRYIMMIKISLWSV